ncbi:hypothetical protein HD554DRAFT_679149 [Boletus coccyginus]|nr:hypothetical protein HD554DRAFT_679149 [Boletus coccyginus]
MAMVERDERFYMTLVTIQVENCLFRVPRQPLESQSKIFRDMFSLPVAEDTEGSSDINPIRLDRIQKKAFKRFLEVLLMGPAYEATTKPCPLFEMWFPVLKLARMWECDRIHKYAIEKMPYNEIPKSPTEKVALAVQHNIQPWLLPGLNELAKRKEPLEMQDLEILGAEVTLKVAAIRESLTVCISQHPRLTSGSRDASRVDFTSAIKRVFEIPGQFRL